MYAGRETGTSLLTIFKKKTKSKKSNLSVIGMIFSWLHFWIYVDGE